MKKLKFFIPVFILFVFFACSSKPSKPNMKEGEWEISVKTEIKGEMPFQMPAKTYTQCITKEKAIPQKVDPEKNCEITKYETKGDTVFWRVECKTSEGLVISEGTVTYRGTIFDGVIKMEHLGTEIIQNINGKWIRECKLK